MPAPRRVAVMFDADAFTPRQHEIVRGLAAYAAQHPGWLLVFDRFAPHRPRDIYAGCITTAPRGSGWMLRQAGVPLVCVDWAHFRKKVPRSIEDRYAAGRLAARHLLERGYRSFAYIGFRRQRQSGTEWASFRRELRKLGRPPSAAHTFVSYACRYQWWDKLMATLALFLERLEPPIGLFVARPGLARAVADVARGVGLRIPEDLGIIAADNDPLLCELPPALTSLHFDYAEVGYRAATLLDRLMDGERPPRQSALVAPTLVARLSTDRAAVADPLVAKALWFIDDRRTEPIRPRHVAAAVGLSQRRLEERLQRARGRTIEQEISRARVTHAMILLGEPRLTLHMAARSSGFGSYDTLRRAFKAHVGMLPSVWRRQQRIRHTGARDAETWTPRKRGRSKPR